MSLISLLIALAAEKSLTSTLWQFNHFYHLYLNSIASAKIIKSPWQNELVVGAVIVLPVMILAFFLNLINDSLLHVIASTLILIVCFGCVKTRESYKSYLLAAFRGEATSCELHHLQLQQDKDQPEMAFGQLLVWLNYRYYIAIMIFFVLFGAPGALFYRLLVTITEGDTIESFEKDDAVQHHLKLLLFWIDWLPVRIVAFGYMFVGHFSKALPVWLESLFDLSKAPYQVLCDVAQKSEDFMVDEEDCTAEPCLLVRLAKRTLLLFLAIIALLIIFGVIS